MSDMLTLQDRLRSRRASSPSAPDDDPDACDDWGHFGVLRGTKDRAILLDLRLKTGQREAVSYALLERVSFDPSVGVTLHFLGTVVKLTGRNLAHPAATGVTLLEALHRHRVSWVAELDEDQSWAAAGDLPVVTGIVIECVK